MSDPQVIFSLFLFFFLFAFVFLNRIVQGMREEMIQAARQSADHQARQAASVNDGWGSGLSLLPFSFLSLFFIKRNCSVDMGDDRPSSWSTDGRSASPPTKGFCLFRKKK